MLQLLLVVAAAVVVQFHLLPAQGEAAAVLLRQLVEVEAPQKVVEVERLLSRWQQHLRVLPQEQVAMPFLPWEEAGKVSPQQPLQQQQIQI